MSWRGCSKRRKSPSSKMSTLAADNWMPRRAISASTAGFKRQVTTWNLDLLAQSRDAFPRLTDRDQVFLQHALLGRVRQLQLTQITQVRFTPTAFARVMVTQTQEQRFELLAAPALVT